MKMDKRKIAIISLHGAWLPYEGHSSRFYNMAKVFSDRGWDVDLISGDYDHFEKRRRDLERIQELNYGFRTSFVYVPPYKKNTDPKREVSNYVAKKGVIRHLQANKYDAVYCAIPPNNIAAGVMKYCHSHRIPCVVDVEDLWPEGMTYLVKNKALQKLIFLYYFKSAETAYKYADAVVGTSDDYTLRATKYNHRDIPSKTIFVGAELDLFDNGVKEYFDEIEKPENDYWVSYAGSISTSYDIRTLVLAAKKLYEIDKDIKIQILGTGQLKDELEKLSKDIGANNVTFYGYTKYPKMAAYLSKSDIVINSFVKGVAQSFVTKIGDYLSSESVIINTLENPLFKDFIDRNMVGININPGNVDILVKTILDIKGSPDEAHKMALRGRKIAEELFDKKVAYQAAVDLVESLL